MSKEGDGAEEALLRREQEDVPPLSISGQMGHFIKWKRAKRHTVLLSEPGHFFLGLVLLATVTGLYFWLDVPLVSAAFTYLVVLVLVSLVSNFSSLIVLSFIGAGCLSYFFAPPIYSFRVDYPQDLIAITAFVITSFIVNFLVTRIRLEQLDHMRTYEALRDANQRLEVTNNALRVENVERKGAEQALQESEYKLRQIIETVPSHLWSASPNFEPTHLNQRLMNYIGWRFEEFKHGGWEASIHSDDLPETAKAISHAVQTGSHFEVMHRLRRADGEYRWHHARGEPLRDQEGRIIQWYGLSVDIDEAKKAEDRLRRSEAYLAEAQWLSHTGSAVYNETTILYWSDETYRIFGIDPRNGLPSYEAALQTIHPDDRERVQEEARQGVRQKRDYALEYRLVLSGAIKYIEGFAHPKFSASGELMEVVSTIIDVTERNRFEQALRESEAKFRDYAETASDWFWEIGPDYKFTLLTENAFGSRPDDRIGTSCWDHALDLETEPEKWRLIQATLDSRKPFRDFVYCSDRRNGSPMHVKASGKPVFDADGGFRGYRGTGTDVTALIRAKEEHERLRQLESDLAHMNRLSMMGELAASLAHEIAQPIATARNNARAAMHFLDRSPPGLDQVREALACVVDDADRAGEILDRIRDHIKKAPPRKERVDLNQAITDVIALAQGAIVRNTISIQTRLTEGVSDVQADCVQLQQVVLNLILNAVEAMGSIEVGVRELSITTEQQEAGGVLVTVRDSGPGIDPGHLDRVFDAFYTTKSSGVGMGLSICRSIIHAHGGRLWADVNTPRGAVFRFTLPGADKELTSSFRPARLTRAQHEDTVSDAARQRAYEDNK
jgi:PAS domain S-box-containing protein